MELIITTAIMKLSSTMVLLLQIHEELKEVRAHTLTQCQSEALRDSATSLSHMLSKKTVNLGTML
jgi:hypothetical protein